MTDYRTCPHCGTRDYGTPFCVSCQRPLEKLTAGPAAAPEGSPETPARVEAAAEPAGQPPVRFAGFFRRFFALFVDYLIVGIFADILSWSYHIGAGVRSSTIDFGISFTVTFLLFAVYFTVLTGDSGQTFGKRILGIRVVRVDGGPVSYGQAFLRFIGYIPSFWFFSLGFIWAAFDARKQAWHDKIAGTLVVRTRG